MPIESKAICCAEVRHRRVESTKRAAGCYQQKKGRISLVLGHGVYTLEQGRELGERKQEVAAVCRRRRSPRTREEGKRQLGVVFGTEQRRRRAAAVVPAARAMSGQSGPGRRRCFRTSRVSYPALSRCRFSVVHHVRWCSGAATSRCCVSALPVTGHSFADPAR